MVQSLGGNITTNAAEGEDPNDRAVPEYWHCCQADRPLFAVLSMARLVLSSGHRCALYLSNRSGVDGE